MTETAQKTLTEFLLARIAEDGAAGEVARTHYAPWDEAAGYGYVFYGHGADRLAMTVDPARVLAEVEAKRRIVERFPDAQPDGDGWNEAGVQVLELLAAVYSDHPDYRPEWRA